MVIIGLIPRSNITSIVPTRIMRVKTMTLIKVLGYLTIIRSLGLSISHAGKLLPKYEVSRATVYSERSM